MHLQISHIISISLSLSPILGSSLRSLDTTPVLHFTLSRRGGEFNGTKSNKDHVDLGYLAAELQRSEGRFNLTRREVKGNRLVRKAKVEAQAGNTERLLAGDISADGIWYVLGTGYSIICMLTFHRYAKAAIGVAPQEVEMDLNMLVSDFYILTTGSHYGSRFDEFFSKSYGVE